MPIPTYYENHVLSGSLKSDADGIRHEFIFAINGNDRLALRYFGEFEQGCLVARDDAPAKLVALDPASGSEALLFDGAAHGYNALFCDEYDADVTANRPLQDLDDQRYQIRITVFYNIDSEEERDDFCDENGTVELINGETISFAQLQRDGIDAIGIELIDDAGDVREIVNEELA